MSSRCPVCKARLWKQPLLRRVKCPRCGAEFRPTLSSEYFQLLLFVVLFLTLSTAALLSRNVIWLGLLVVTLATFIVWFLPRVVNLELQSPEAVMEGAPNGEKLDYWRDEKEEDPGWNPLFPILLLIAVVMALVVVMIQVIA